VWRPTFAAASNVFVGIEYSMLHDSPYLATAQPMSWPWCSPAGMATIASTMLGSMWVCFQPYFPSIAGHLDHRQLSSVPGGGDDGGVLLVRHHGGRRRWQASAIAAVAAGAGDRGATAAVWRPITQGANERPPSWRWASTPCVAFVGLLALARCGGRWNGAAGLAAQVTLQILLACCFFPWSG